MGKIIVTWSLKLYTKSTIHGRSKRRWLTTVLLLPFPWVTVYFTKVWFSSLRKTLKGRGGRKQEDGEGCSGHWKSHGYCLHEFTAAVVICTRPAHKQASKSSRMDAGRAHKAPVLGGMLLIVDSCRREEMVFFWGCGHWQVACAPMDGLIPM